MRCWLRDIRTTDSGQSARKTRRRARCGELQAGREDALRHGGGGWACGFSESPRAPSSCVGPLIAGVPSALSRNAGGRKEKRATLRPRGFCRKGGSERQRTYSGAYPTPPTRPRRALPLSARPISIQGLLSPASTPPRGEVHSPALSSAGRAGTRR